MTDAEAEARATYRAAWLAWRATTDHEEKRRLEQVMDGCQPTIALGPWDPRWKEFAASLPGYLEFWGNLRKAIPVLAQQLMENLAKKN